MSCRASELVKTIQQTERSQLVLYLTRAFKDRPEVLAQIVDTIDNCPPATIYVKAGLRIT